MFHFSMFRSGNGSNSSNVNTGTSTGAVSRSKNAPGNRTDIGWKHGTNVLGNGKKLSATTTQRSTMGEFLDSSLILLGLDGILNLMLQCLKKLRCL